MILLLDKTILSSRKLIYYNTKINMLSNSLHQKDNRNSQQSKIKNEVKTNSQLVVQIRIKDRIPKDLVISNINNETTVNQQIRWFISTNNLKDQAYGFIKSIIQDKIKNRITPTSKNYGSLRQKMIPVRNKENQIIQSSPTFIEKKIENSMFGKTSVIKSQAEPRRIQIQLSYTPTEKDLSEVPQVRVIDDTFAFNSQFTLPSSIGEQERSQLTDQMFDTAERNTSNFSTIHEIKSHERKQTRINAPLSIKKFPDNFDFSTAEIGEYTQTKAPKKRIPVKINLNSRQMTSTSFNQKSPSIKRRSISTKERKNSIMRSTSRKKQNTQKKQKFIIYDADYLEGLVTKQSSSLKTRCTESQNQQNKHQDQALRMLFNKMTSKNPNSVHKLDSQYVSYEKLTKEQLLLMGNLFQKMDHQELSNLQFDLFKLNVTKYCQKELEQLQSSKNKSNGRLSWTFPAPTMPRY